MNFLIPAVLLAGGLVILIFGAEWLVRGASSIARKFGISPLIIGLTVVAFGTSAPELTVNVYSALTGATGIAVGNIIGSNVANILLILGISAIIVPLSVKSSTVRWEIPFALMGSLMLLAFGLDTMLDGAVVNAITRTDGIALLGFFVIFMYYIFALVKHDRVSRPEEGEIVEKTLPLLHACILIFAGLAGLVFGGKILVDQAVVLATLAGLSQSVIGLTVVAIGTSLPELATSVIAAMKKEADIAIGNIIGSNIFNIFWILGVTSLIAPLPVPDGFLIDASVSAGATALLLISLFSGTRGRIDRWQGFLLVGVYIAYLLYLVI